MGTDGGPTVDAGEIGPAALRLARTAVEGHLRTGVIPEPPAYLPTGLREKSAAFVSLRAHGQLRGCIGTLAPTRVHAAWEIIFSAISAATRDPRFAPVLAAELADLAYEVDLLGPLVPAAGLPDLDPKLYGVVVEGDGRRGVLLPGLDGIDSAAQQVEVACRKAGLPTGAPVRLYRFQVRRFVEAML